MRSLFSGLAKSEQLPDDNAEDLVEYLYWDENRLNSYFDQVVSGTPSEYSVELTLGIAKAQRRPRATSAYSNHEKAQIIEKQLKRKKMFQPMSKVYPWSETQRFGLVSFEATKLFIAATSETQPIVIWSAAKNNREENDHSPNLYLLEGWSPDGAPTVNKRSNFSALAHLLQRYPALLPNKEPRRGILHYVDLIDVKSRGNLVEFLVQELGAERITRRSIKSLFYIREVFMDTLDFNPALFCYPIYIAAAEGNERQQS